MIIDLRTLEIPHELVMTAVAHAAVVRQLNRNKTGNGIISLITDDATTVKKHVTLDQRDDRFIDTCLGLTWHRPQGAYVWLSTMRRFGDGGTQAERPYDLANAGDRKRVIQTLVHELAHAMVGYRHAHGWTFRRMYALLLEFVGNRCFGEWIGEHFIVDSEVRNAVIIYQRTGEYYRPNADAYEDAWSSSGQRRREEVAKHVAAVDRMARRFADVHILG